MADLKHARWLRWSWSKAAAFAGLVVVGGMAFYVGRISLAPQAVAAPPRQAVAHAQDAPPPSPPPESPRKVVAYAFGVPISREELADYVIARQGVERLDLLINRRIVEIACQRAGIEVTAQEMEAAFQKDLLAMKCDKNQLVNTILKQYGKTLYEWKEDVVRPKLMMGKLCRARVTVTEDDVKNAFEAQWGEKVEGRLILWPNGEENVAMRMYGEIRESEKKFATAATQQASPSLASVGGKIKPVGRFTTGCPELEDAAMLLQPGQMTQLIGTPEGRVVFKCDKRIPGDASKKIETERQLLEEIVVAKKMDFEMKKIFSELKDEAKPVNLLKQAAPTQTEREQDVEATLKEAGIPVPRIGEAPPPTKGATSPNGN